MAYTKVREGESMESKTRELIDWTPELIAQLTKLHAEGLSYTAIADKLGLPGKKNAVLGKADRLKLPKRRTPYARMSAKEKLERSRKVVSLKRERERERIKRQAKAQAKSLAIKPRVVPLTEGMPIEADTRFLRSKAWEALDGSKPVALVDLDKHQCKWPLNGPNDTHLFCALPADGRYCPSHTYLSNPRA